MNSFFVFGMRLDCYIPEQRNLYFVDRKSVQILISGVPNGGSGGDASKRKLDNCVIILLIW